MNAGLVLLLKLKPRGFVRRIARRFGSSQGRIAMFAGAGLLLFFVTMQVAELAIERGDAPARAAERLDVVRTVGPLTLAGFLFMLDLSGRGLFFLPAEIDFLFPAPISRRELLLYHLASRGGLHVLSGLWVALFTLRFAGNVLGGLLGAVLALVFLHLAAEAWSLLVAAVGERFGRKIRLTVWALVAAVLFWAARTATTAAPPGTSPFEMVRAATRTPVVMVMTAPAKPFVEAFAAESVVRALPWVAACLAIIALLVLAILRLDVVFEEAAVASSRRVQDRLRSVRSGEGAFVASASSLRRTLPRLPRLRGAGPLAHRQLTELVRNPTALIWSAAGMAFIVGLLLWLPSVTTPEEGTPRDMGIPGLAMTLALTTFMNQGFAHDFRRDLDRMALLKTLPAPAWVVAAGQLVAPSAVFTLIQWVLIALIAAFSAIPREALVFAALAAPAWNWFSSCLDNAMFLVLPYRVDPEDPTNMPFLGRLFASMFVKGICLAALAVPVTITVVAGVGLGGFPGAALLVLALLLLAGAAVAGTFFVAAAFRGFDVSTDI